VAPDSDTYDDAEWAASTGHAPLTGRPPGEAFLIYRHWIWANLQKIAVEQFFISPEAFRRGFIGPDDPEEMVMVARGPAYMFVWYGLLWSVIEALEERHIDLRGPLREDIDHVSDALRRCRNAIMHVPRDNSLLDRRIEQLVSMPEAVVRIRRVHHGLGRLLREEVQRQSAAPPPLAEPAQEA